MKELRTLALVGLVAISGCTQPNGTLFCRVADSPSAFVNQRITLTGIANMYQHSSTLRHQECPDRLIFLYMTPRIWRAGDEEFPDGEFFSKLATHPDSSVSVVGQIIRTPDQPTPYVFRVESGVYQSSGG